MIIRNVAAWISTEEAVDWLKLNNPDVEITMHRVDGHGVLLEMLPLGYPQSVQAVRIGVNSADLVRLGRYLLAVAAAQGQDITAPGVKP